MRGYTFLITTKTINDYINGCIELFLKNNFKIILWLTIFSYICGCDNNSSINYNNDCAEMNNKPKEKKYRTKALTGNSGYTGGKKLSEYGGQYDRVVDGVHYRDRVKKGVR